MGSQWASQRHPSPYRSHLLIFSPKHLITPVREFQVLWCSNLAVCRHRKNPLGTDHLTELLRPDNGGASINLYLIAEIYVSLPAHLVWQHKPKHRVHGDRTPPRLKLMQVREGNAKLL